MNAFYDETFWSNLDELQRVLICFLKKPTENNYATGNCSKSPVQILNIHGKNADLVINSSNGCKLNCKDEKTQLLKKIENIIMEFNSKKETNDFATIQVPNRKTWKNTSFEIDRGMKMIQDPALTNVGKQGKDSLKIVRFLKVLLRIHKLITTNTFRTKREIYYEDVPLFKNQTILDHILDDIACLLKTPKVKLHVLTTSKGCIAGNLKYKEADGTYVDCQESSQGVLLSNDVGSIKYIQSDARFILIVEKSAVFQMLLDCNITRLLHPCIMITGKGFPDVNTREMLRKLFDTLHIPVLGLVDADPYGIEILSIYKFGSMAMSFDVENLAVPHLRWLGVLPSDIENQKFPKTATIPMSSNDVKKANHLLKRPYIQTNVEWKHQVQILLEKSEKAEIEGLAKISDNYLPEVYLPNKIRYGGWI
ncbi:hypothetical protein JTE90_027378 [Oedothorax gibbosus]|uniref:DNA topoisomerase (ATP-hydrolyzing) n=1 Tax=Oedothorax gibbosus TaxID=931172 RepID=A0AAV6VZ49_9ARAC|nr:hypothetical protein JTE90_027378 [Oedothorax gibbosus]